MNTNEIINQFNNLDAKENMSITINGLKLNVLKEHVSINYCEFDKAKYHEIASLNIEFLNNSLVSKYIYEEDEIKTYMQEDSFFEGMYTLKIEIDGIEIEVSFEKK